MRSVLAAVLLLSLPGCQAGDREEQAPAPVAAPDAAASDEAVTPSDSWCLDPAELASEPIENDALWRRYRHWDLCVFDQAKALRYLDVLVALNDPVAVHTKSIILQPTDPAQSARLQKQAQDLGYRPRSRMDEMREIAGLK